MGVVYKAEDTKLNRQVALKFLAQHLLNEPEAKQRFLREAQAAAALNHPNVCPVYEIDEEDGNTFLAMAFLRGETLEDRIAEGPLPIKEALDVARQVAEGLHAAHAEGVVHRDIKPANILLSPEGRPTIMDFGLARLTEASKLTRQDQTVGTAAYMSPEQLQGGNVDHRTDIWALGCVLYEMVAGVRPFKGEYHQALAYEIVGEHPEPLTGVRAGVPMELEFIVGKCLAKEANDRYQHANEIAVDLRTLAEKLKSGRSMILSAGLPTAAPSAMATPAGDHPLSKYRVIENVEQSAEVSLYRAEDTRLGKLVDVRVLSQAQAQRAAKRQRFQSLALFFLGVIAAVLAALLLWRGDGSGGNDERVVRRFTISHEGLRSAAISPDGRNLAYAVRAGGDSSLWLRPLSSQAARPIPGTVGVYAYYLVGAAAWSPDSRTIAFAADGRIKRVGIEGGDAVTLCELPLRSGNSFMGASWSPDGETLVFSSGLKLWSVPARGGQPVLLFEPEPHENCIHPSFLPGDGTRLVFTDSRGGGVRLVSFDLASGERRTIGPGQSAAYSPSGHLVHGSVDDLGQEGIWATPFSLDSMQASGDSFPLDEEGVSPSIARDGSLVYNLPATATQMVVRNRSGELVRTIGEQVTSASAPVLAPKEDAIALRVDGDTWVYDLERDFARPLTDDPAQEGMSAWTPSGRKVVYVLPGRTGLGSMNADGSGEKSLLLDSERGVNSFGLSPDNRYVAYNAGDPSGGEGGIWYREIREDGSLGERISFLRTPNAENSPMFSPDVRHLAYISNESGRFEVYVRPFPTGDGKWQVSTNTGTSPRWSSDGSELFYVEPGSRLMSAPISREPEFSVGRPELVFESPDIRGAGNGHSFDVFQDGRRFLTVTSEGGADASVGIVQNWYEEFRNREQN